MMFTKKIDLQIYAYIYIICVNAYKLRKMLLLLPNFHIWRLRMPNVVNFSHVVKF